MPRFPGLLACLCLCSPLGPAFAEEAPAEAVASGTGQQVTAGALIDHDFGFRLDLPVDRWTLLGEDDVRQLEPDATAGATIRGGGVCVVMIERAPGFELSEFSDLVTAAVGDFPVIQRSETTWAGLPAIRTVSRGRDGEREVQLDHLLFLRGAWGTQLMCSQSASDGASEVADQFFGAASLLPGTPKGRSRLARVIDQDGVGWRTRDGVFEGAATGLVVRPADGWRVSVGDELEEMNEEADVGLVLGDSLGFAVVLVERLVSEELEVQRQRVIAATAENVAHGVPEPAVRWDVGEVERTFHRTRSSEGPPFVFSHAAFERDGDLVQVLAWYLAPMREQVEASLPAALAGIELLDEPARAALAARVGPSRGDRAVGPDFSVRGGRWQHFTYGLSWSPPPDGYWRTFAGDEARRRFNDSALLVVEEVARSLDGVIWLEEKQGRRPLRKVHLETVRRFSNAAVSKPRTLSLPDGTALVSDVELDVDGQTFRYRMSTAFAPAGVVQMMIYGLPGNVDEGSAQVDAALASLVAGEMNQPLAVSGDGTWRDDRAGFAYEAPGPGWECREMTVPELRPIGSQVNCQAADHGVLVMGLHAATSGQDEGWFSKLAATLMPQEFAADVGPPTESAGELAGRPSRRLESEGPEIDVAFDFVIAQGTVFIVMTMVEHGSGDAEMLRGGFSILE